MSLLALDADSPGTVARQLDVDALIGSDEAGVWFVLPDPDGPGRHAALATALSAAGPACALGPAVATGEAARSLRWARLTLELVKRGALPSERPTRTTEHLATVILLQDEEMAGALADALLAPIQALPPPERERLLETLAAWLAHQRHTPAVTADRRRPVSGRARRGSRARG